MLHWGHLQDDGVPEIATTTSLIVTGVVLTVTTVASVTKARRDPGARAHAGSLRVTRCGRQHDERGIRQGASARRPPAGGLLVGRRARV